MLVWGRRGYRKIIGELKTSQNCEHCHNECHYKVLEVGFWFTLFFIPIFKYGKKFCSVCSICGDGRQYVSEDAAMRDLRFGDEA